MTTVAEQILDELYVAGVRNIYGLIGDSLNPITEAIRRHGDVRWIHVHNIAVCPDARAQGRCQPPQSTLLVERIQTHRSDRPFTFEGQDQDNVIALFIVAGLDASCASSPNLSMRATTSPAIEPVDATLHGVSLLLDRGVENRVAGRPGMPLSRRWASWSFLLGMQDLILLASTV